MLKRRKLKVAALALLLGLLGWGAFSAHATRNQLIIYDRNLESAWSLIQSVYRLRAQLVPELVDTVTAYAGEALEPADLALRAFAQTSGLAARSQAGLPTAAVFYELEAAQLELSAALSHLLLTIDQHPELAQRNDVAKLHRGLTDVERRLEVEKRRFNRVIQDYNDQVKSFPTLLFARFFGFDKRPSFRMTESRQRLPGVDI